MAPTGTGTTGAEEFIYAETLNPIGPPNMLSTGAIGFDVKTLIYTQFLDNDIEYSIPDSAPAGRIITQIPYGLLTSFNNGYIKGYGMLHGRYTGNLQYRLALVGNPLFSGSIMIAWSPYKVAGTMQQYLNYKNTLTPVEELLKNGGLYINYKMHVKTCFGVLQLMTWPRKLMILKDVPTW